jgi:hypothetical protein
MTTLGLDPTIADLTITITVGAHQERVALTLLRVLNELLTAEIPDMVDAASEEIEGLPFELEVANMLAVRRGLEDEPS